MIWTASLFAVSQASQGLGVNTADALFFLRFGVEYLPTMILLTGPVVMVTTLVFAAGLGRLGSRLWLVAVSAGLGALLILERTGIALDLPGIYPIVWLGGQVAMMASLTSMWTAAGEVCTTRQAKRLYPLFASAGIAGAVVGNALTGPLANSVGTENVLLIQAGLLLSAGALVNSIGLRFFRSKRVSDQPSVFEDFRSGLRETLGSPFLRMVAGVGVAFGALLYLVVFPFSEIVTESFGTEAEVAGFLGLFFSVATMITFLVSLFVTNRLFARLGVVVTLIAVPLFYAGGFGIWLVSFGLLTAALFRGAQFVTVNAIGGTAWSSLFNVLPTRRRGQVMAFMTAGPMQLGTALAGVLLIAGKALPQEAGFSVGLVAALATLVLVWRMRGTYGDALVGAVKRGLVDIFTTPTTGIQKPALDADTLKALTEQLGDDRPEARIVAIAMLGRIDDVRAGSLIQRALDDEEPRVRAAGLDAIGQRHEIPDRYPELLTDPDPRVRLKTLELMWKQRVSFPPGIDGVLEDPSPDVRAMAAVVVGGERGASVVGPLLDSEDDTEIIAGLRAVGLRPNWVTDDVVRFLHHTDQQVRAAAAPVVASLNGREVDIRHLLDDPSVVTRSAAAAALAGSQSGVGSLLEVLENGSVVASQAALGALTERNAAPERLVQWVPRIVSRAAYLRRHRQALESEDTDSATMTYLCKVLDARERREEQWAVMALTATESRGAMGTIARGIWNDDEETRSQALEALESLADRHVARELTGLLEEAVTSELPGPRESLRQLTEDFDDWIRALAFRCLAEDLSAGVERLRAAAAADSSPLVRVALSRWDAPAMQETETLDLMDRVLAIQRVPMFSQVDPEDLERIASVTRERHYEADEVAFREGDKGDEMLLIIRGEVVISRERDGETEIIRTYGPGNHVGELALLRSRPRAADVIAGPEGVHTLVLRSPELHAILEERPGVAMSMLGTLAERIATM